MSGEVHNPYRFRGRRRQPRVVPMRACLIFNPRAGTADRIKEFLLHLTGDHRCELRPTNAAGDARRIAREAVELEILLFGTGNDLAQSLASGYVKATQVAASVGLVIRPCCLVHQPILGVHRRVRLDGRCAGSKHGRVEVRVGRRSRAAGSHSYDALCGCQALCGRSGSLGRSFDGL